MIKRTETAPDDLDCDVTLLACGCLSVRIGRIKVELSPAETVHLQRELSRAAQRLALAGAPSPAGERMH